MIIFDYGGTLAHFYRLQEFDGVLRDALWAARSVILGATDETPQDEVLWQRALDENYEDPGHRVRTLEARLGRIFGSDNEVIQSAAEAFTRSIRDVGTLIPGARRVLRDLTERGYRLGLVSNTPWGCPGDAWLRDLEARGIDQFFEVALSCRDVGFRKPAPQVFHHAVELFGVSAGTCLFVGDDMCCDIQGSRCVGMDAVLYDPEAESRFTPSVRKLEELLDFLDSTGSGG